MDELQMNECHGFYADDNGRCNCGCWYQTDDGYCSYCVSVKKEGETDTKEA